MDISLFEEMLLLSICLLIGLGMIHWNHYRYEEAKSRLEIYDQYYSILFHNYDQALFELDRSGKFIEANVEAEKMLESSREELLQVLFYSFVVTEDLERVLQYFCRALQGEPQDFDVIFFTETGNGIHLHIKMFPVLLKRRVNSIYCIGWSHEFRKETP